MSAQLVLLGALLCIASGGVAVLPGKRLIRMTPFVFVTGAIAGLAGCLLGLTSATTTVTLPWMIPGGEFKITVDALSAFFAAPAFLIAGAGALYTERYWPPERRRAAWVRGFFGLLTGSLVIVMVAGHTILFLAAWEIVTIAAFLLVGTEDEDSTRRKAAWLYLAASHVAMLALFAMIAILHSLTRTWAFDALPAATASLPVGKAIFALAVFGFGIKAGLMPLHVWLPGAHAAAPSHVSAVMSGVVIKMGIYGLVRILSLFDAIPYSFGTTLLLLGILSSILGVAFALAQHDLKRLLAYHSIENIGIIVCGLGIGIVAQAHGSTRIAVLGFAGALLHVWNHGLFKSLLFLSAGSAIEASHTREIDRMGGLARRMPWTALAFLTGAIAICGLPPLNGFVSEWLIYVSAFTAVTAPEADWSWLLVLGVPPALALTGALALACFVKAFGAVFLGNPRSHAASAAHESPLGMRAAMLPLAAACFAIGLAPTLLGPMLGHATAVLAPGMPVSELEGALRGVQTSAIAVAVVAALALGIVSRLSRKRGAGPTWDCGYAAVAPRAQYTASSLAKSITEVFAWAMPAVESAPGKLPLFPREASFGSHVPDTVLDHALLPALRRAERLISYARYAQSARVQFYILSLGVTLVVLLFWSAL
ncbi:MAG: proton-conducting transporter transmembrane domain-containing protein [Thermoanaerobaculia bacterium]